ncbi:hypothetical protein GOP47_0000311 [Adiantum capillus-veneris]|uniref:Transcription repressor n=1 Tax=Adiantum capillus-veneris TaxID=13818 RepID=A0A9D4ZSR7_ADICA|nr:hypothetical protein GOP47_0000311 [Adiantum capillus-veneris]
MQKVKQKQLGSPLLPLSDASHQSLDDSLQPPATASFAQALSLHKAISRARASHLEAELAGFLANRKDPENIRISHTSNWNDMQSAAAETRAFTDRSQGCYVGLGLELESLPALPLMSAAIDNDTEGSTILTPDSVDSSFGSESSSVGIFECANCSLIKLGDVPTPADSNLGHDVEFTKCNENSSSGAVEINHSMFNSATHHRHDCCTVRSFDTLCSTRLETSSSLAINARSALIEQSEVLSSSASFVAHGKLTATSDMHGECNAAVGISEGTILGRILYGKWEENSALIAAENPSLMLSSKWQEERVGSCSSLNARSSENSDTRERDVCKDGEFKVCLCESERDDRVLPVNEPSINGLPEYGPEDEGNVVEFHKSKHDAYIKNGRGHRGSSFSASLPENMKGVVRDSVALVKMSQSPYEDFRQSMYEMIMEQDLEEASMDVEERLLQCYLTLNSPELHPLIKEVFSDVWSSILMNER